MWRFGVLAAAVGCASEVPESEFESANLEQARVTPSEALTRQLDVRGTLAVEAAGLGWELSVTTPSASYSVEVQSHSGVDLSPLDGLDARLAVAPVPGSAEHSVAVLTPEGEVLYLLEPVSPGTLTESGFGAGLLDRGNELGLVERSGWSVALRSAWLRTDGVELEVLPGEPVGVWIRDREHRVVLLAAWDVVGEADGCDVPDSRLAYEVLRVDAPVDEAPLRRDPAVPLVGESCEDVE
jgi:hypothetical protein